MMNATTVNALPAKNLQRGEHLSLLSLSISLRRWKKGCHLRWNRGSGLWLTLVVAPGQGPSSQVQLTTEPGANFGTRRVRTAASPSLAIRATSTTHSAAEVPNAKRLSTAQVMPQRCTMTRARPTWHLAFQHLTPRAVCLGRSV